MTTRRREKQGPEEVVAQLRDADAMLNVSRILAAVLRALATCKCWRAGPLPRSGDRRWDQVRGV
jgi:hypothetical protein